MHWIYFGSGYNKKYGLPGLNKATETKLKLLPKFKISRICRKSTKRIGW